MTKPELERLTRLLVQTRTAQEAIESPQVRMYLQLAMNAIKQAIES